MSLSNHYDWIVLGDHPGALLSASLAAKLGLSVLVLPKCSTQKVMFSKRGQCLDPESNFMIGFGEKGLLHEALRRIAGLPAEGELNKSDTLAQILTPERRVAIRESSQDVSSECAREFPSGSHEKEVVERGLKAVDEVLGYWLRFPSQLSIDPAQKKRSKAVPANWDDLLRKLQAKKKSGLESEFLSALAYGFSGQFPEDWSSAEWVHAVALAQSGASLRGGLSAYRRMLLRSAKKLGATVLDDVECRNIFIENRRFTGIQVSVSAKMIAGTGCVLGSAVSEFADRMSFTGPKWLRRRQYLPKPIGWKFTIALTVRDDAIVPGVSRRMIWKEPNAPALEIEIADPSEYGSKEPDHKLIFLRTVLPFTQESLVVAYQRMVAARMFRVATEIMPFLEYHILNVYPDFRSAAATSPASLETSDQLSEVYGFAIPTMIPENLRVYEAAFRNVSTGFEGLFVSAGESFPRLGSLGPTIAALEATAWIAHRSGLAGPFV